MYIPAGAATPQQSQYRILIQGYPGTGKTHSALTFPNTVVINHDRGLVSHVGRKDVLELNINSPTFNKGRHPKDWVLQFLLGEALKLEEDQTLVHDSWTTFQDAVDDWLVKNPPISHKGKEDGYEIWRIKMDVSRIVCNAYAALQCNIIVPCHEQVDRDEKGRIDGLKPLMPGQFGDKLGGYFTENFRQLMVDKPTTDVEWGKIKFELFGVKNRQEFEATFFPMFPDRASMNFWQTRSDAVVKCKTSLIGAPHFIPANYTAFSKYARKFPSATV